MQTISSSQIESKVHTPRARDKELARENKMQHVANASIALKQKVNMHTMEMDLPPKNIHTKIEHMCAAASISQHFVVFFYR